MAEVASTFVSVVPSAKGFGSTLNRQIGGDLDSSGKKAGSRFGTALKVGALAAVGGAVLAGGFLKGTVDDASDLEESMSKVGVVFGKSSGQVVAASKDAATSMGLTKSAYLGATGSLGNLLVSLDLAPKKAAGMSQEMVKLAGDLASFNNVSPEEALAALQSGLTGETEPLKKFGVNMNDATLKAQALKMGLIKTTSDALDPQTKALAAQALIMDQTATAQGDFARTSGGLANQQRILSAQFGDVKATIGTALLPIMTRFVTFLNAKLPGAIKGIAGAFTAVTGAFKSGGLGGVISLVGDKIAAALPIIKAKLAAWGKAFIAWIAPLIPPLLAKLRVLAVRLGQWITGTALPWLATKLVKWGKAFVEWIGPMIPPMLVKLGKFAGRIYAWLLDVGLPRMIKNLEKWGKAFVDWIEPKIPGILSAIGNLLGKLVVWILTKGLPKLVVALLRLAAALVKWIAPQIPKVLAAIGGLIARLGSWVLNTGLPLLATKLTTMGLKAFEALKTAASEKVDDLIAFAKEIPGKIVDGMGNLAWTLYDAGKDLISGLTSGITDKISGAVDAVAGGLGKIKDMLPGSPIKTGPLKSWNNGGAGKRLVGMLATGLSDTRPIDGAMDRLTSRISTPDLTASVSATTSGLAQAANRGSAPAGRQGGQMFGDVHVVAHDYQDFTRQTEHRARRASGGAVAWR